LRGARFGENLVKVGADLIGISPKDRRGLVFEQLILFVVTEKIGLTGERSSIIKNFKRRFTESGESCAILVGDASRASDFSPQLTKIGLELMFVLAF
jgi:hypothetical protein